MAEVEEVEFGKKTWVVNTNSWRWMDTVWDKPI